MRLLPCEQAHGVARAYHRCVGRGAPRRGMVRHMRRRRRHMTAMQVPSRRGRRPFLAGTNRHVRRRRATHEEKEAPRLGPRSASSAREGTFFGGGGASNAARGASMRTRRRIVHAMASPHSFQRGAASGGGLASCDGRRRLLRRGSTNLRLAERLLRPKSAPPGRKPPRTAPRGAHPPVHRRGHSREGRSPR